MLLGFASWGSRTLPYRFWVVGLRRHSNNISGFPLGMWPRCMNVWLLWMIRRLRLVVLACLLSGTCLGVLVHGCSLFFVVFILFCSFSYLCCSQALVGLGWLPARLFRLALPRLLAPLACIRVCLGRADARPTVSVVCA